MKTYLLALVAVGLLGGVSRGAEALPSVGVDWGHEAFWESVGKLPQRLKGRVLGAFVRKGMTQEQVKQVLGPGSKPFPPLLLTGACLCGHMPYFHLGMSVSYWGDEEGILRVTEVRYDPLFN
jgi:hypothetical protein